SSSRWFVLARSAYAIRPIGGSKPNRLTKKGLWLGLHFDAKNAKVAKNCNCGWSGWTGRKRTLVGNAWLRAFSWLVCRDSAQRRASRSRSADAGVAGGHAEVARRRAAKFAASGSLQTNHENALARAARSAGRFPPPDSVRLLPVCPDQCRSAQRLGHESTKTHKSMPQERHAVLVAPAWFS